MHDARLLYQRVAPRHLIWVSALLMLALAAAAMPAAEAKKRAATDLTVLRVVDPPASSAPGAPVLVGHTVRNRGRGKAGKTAVGYWLSSDRRRGKGDVKLAGTRKVPALRKRRKSSAKKRVALPAAVSPGLYHVIACVDPRRKVREAKEGNNCRASKGRMRIAAGGAAGAPATGTQTGAPIGAPTGAPFAAPSRFPLVANARSVQPRLQTERAVTRTIGTIGGTVSTTAADGTTFTLTIPMRALPSDVPVTLTPVDAVGGSPLSKGLVGAVEIKPHGLILLEPAKLVIDPPADAPVDDQTGFLYHGGNDDFHLYPLTGDRELTMQLMHFSTPGVGLATDGDRQAALSTVPVRPQAQVEQVIAELLRQERANQLEGRTDTTEQTMSQVVDVLAGYYRDIIDPLADRALSDDAAIEPAVSELLAWARQLQLLGAQDDPRVKALHDGVTDRIVAIFENAIHRAHDRCVNQHKLDDIVRLMKLARITALLGSSLSDEAFEKVLGCARFEVRFDSDISGTDSGVGGEGWGTWTRATDYTVRATAQVEFDATMLLRGAAPMTHAGSTYRYVHTAPCSEGQGTYEYIDELTSTTPGTLDVLLLFDLQLREPGVAPPPAYGLRVWPIGGWAIEETYKRTTTACGGAVSETDITDPRWRWAFDSLHNSEPRFQDFAGGTGDVIATKRWQQTDDDLNEDTSITVVHRPR